MSARSKKKDKTYYPEQLAAAAELGLDPENDTLLMKLAHDMCRPESLTKDWTVEFDAASRKRVYTNLATNEVQWLHPLIGYYKGAIFMERGGYQRLLERDAAQPPTNEDIFMMGEYLGIRRNEHPYVLEVARMAISAALPPEWIEVVDRNNQVSYRNIETQEVSRMHPLDAYFVELRNRRRKEARSKGTSRTQSISEGKGDALDTEDTVKKLRLGGRQRPRRDQESQKQEAQADQTEEAVSEARVRTLVEWIYTGATDAWKISDTNIRLVQSQSDETDRLNPCLLTAYEQGVSFDHIAQDEKSWEAYVCSEIEAAGCWDNKMCKRAMRSLTIVSVKPAECSSSARYRSKLAPTVKCVQEKREQKVEVRIASLSKQDNQIINILQGDGTSAVQMKAYPTDICWKQALNADEASAVLQKVDQICIGLGSEDILLLLEFYSPESDSPFFRLSFLELVSCMDHGYVARAPIEISLCALLQCRCSNSATSSNPVDPSCSSDLSNRNELCRIALPKHSNMLFNVVFDSSVGEDTTVFEKLFALNNVIDLFVKPVSQAADGLVKTLDVSLAQINRKKQIQKHQIEGLKHQLKVVQSRIKDVLVVYDCLDVTQQEDLTIKQSMEGLEALIELRNKQTESLDKLELEAKDLREKIRALEMENTELEASIKSLRAQAQSQNSNAEEKDNELHQLTAKITELGLQSEQKDQQLASYEVELERLSIECEKVRDLAERIESYDEQITFLTKERKELHQEKSSCQEELATLRQSYDELKVEIAKLKHTESAQTESCNQLQAELESRIAATEACASEKIEQQEYIDSLAKQLDVLKEEKSNIVAQLLASEDRAKTLEVSIKDAQEENNRYKNQAARLEQEASVLNRDLKDLKTMLEDNEKERKYLADRLKTASDVNSRVGILEKEKALLLDRIEGITGKPMGDINDEIPPVPVGFHTPRRENVAKKTECSPEEALKSISRIARLAHPICESQRGGNNKRNDEAGRMIVKNSAELSPTEVVMIVRDLRAERNELRRRDRLWREENTKLKKALRQADDVAKKAMDCDLYELAERLDNLFGLQPPEHLSAIDRLRVSVDGVYLMREEMLSLQRQHTSLSLLLKQEERHAMDREKEMKKLAVKGQGEAQDSVVEKCVSCSEVKNRLEFEKQSLQHDLKQYAAVSGHTNHDMIGSAALRFARSKEFEIVRMERRIEELQTEVNKWKHLHEQRVRPDPLKGNLFKWKSAPLDLHRNYSVELKNLTLAPLSRKKTLPPVSQSSGIPLKLLPTRSKIPDLAEIHTGGFDTRPVPAEIKTKLNRVQDQLLKDRSLGKTDKDERREVLNNFLSGDPRDAEISNLKVRLVRSEKERAETATKATNERRDAQIKLQQATRILEQAQNLTEQLKDVFVNMSFNGNESEGVMEYAASIMDALLARVEKLSLDT